MKLQSMRYVIEIAKYHSVSKAAAALYMTQSALSVAIRDLEEELGITIFMRSNRGVSLTPDGEDCLRYCREIVERTDRFAARYKNRDTENLHFSVSAQHLPFAVRAFNQVLAQHGPEQYSMAIFELPIPQLIADVGAGKSDLGVLAVTEEQLQQMNRVFSASDLTVTRLATLNTYVFLRREHPLGGEEALSLNQLEPYPYVTYDRSADPIFFSEEAALDKPLRRCIHVSDRATKMSVIRSSDAFSIGVDLPNFNRDIYFKNSTTELIAIPFADQSAVIQVGIVEKSGCLRSEIAQQYVKILVQHVQKLSLPGT